MMKEDNKELPVDLVYLWVDGNDQNWREKKRRFIGGEEDDSGKDCKGRYADNDELRHNLRAIEKNAPWIRNIFIVTDNQVPHWLDTSHPKIKIIDHKDILPEESLPCFNSVVIEHRLHLIPGLSEYFLYANDDMFVNKKVEKKDFFTKEGKPIIRLNRRFFRKFWIKHREKSKTHHLDYYNNSIQKAALMVEEKLGKYIGHKPHHNIDTYRKSDYALTYNTFREAIEPTLKNHLRDKSDIQRAIYSFAPIARGNAKVKFVSDKTSFRCHIEKPHYFSRLQKLNPTFFCVNDSQDASDIDRERVAEFLQEKYPEKSSFEK